MSVFQNVDDQEDFRFFCLKCQIFQILDDQGHSMYQHFICSCGSATCHKTLLFVQQYLYYIITFIHYYCVGSLQCTVTVNQQQMNTNCTTKAWQTSLSVVVVVIRQEVQFTQMKPMLFYQMTSKKPKKNLSIFEQSSLNLIEGF